MSNPLKINLYLSDTNPFDPIPTSRGGDPSDIIVNINNEKYKYLQGLYINRETSRRTRILFEFNDVSNTNKDINGSSYLGKGGLTAVFGVNSLTPGIIPGLPDRNLVIRIVDSFTSDDMDAWIEKYKSNKALFDENIIQIYMYGEIHSPTKGFVGFYMMTRYYYDWTYIQSLDYTNTIKYYIEMLDFLIKLKSQGYFYRDLKSTNIGLDIKDSRYIFIVLDYDDITLINDSDKFFENFKVSGCFSKYCAGTFIPYFIIKDYLTLNSNWLTKFDKVYVVGLAEITIKLFFTPDTNLIKAYSMLNEPSKHSSCIHYYQFIDLFDSKEKYDQLEYSLISMSSKFMEIGEIKKASIIYIILNLLNKNYSLINEPETIKNEFTNGIINLPSHITTSTGKIIPIEQINFVPKSSSSASSLYGSDDFVGGKINFGKK